MPKNKLVAREITPKILKWMRRPEVIAIRGPRQAGKTTLLSTLKGKLVDRGVNPDLIEIINFEDREKVEQFEIDPLAFIRSFLSSDEKRQYLFLDEYQYIEQGGQKLKLVFDELSDRVKIVVTGSSSLELTTQTAKFMVGRLLSAYLFPFSFEEFLTAKSKRLARIYRKRKSALRGFLFEGKSVPEKFFKAPFLKELNKYWKRYAIFGGYPAVVTAESKETKKDLLRGLANTYIERDVIGLLGERSIKEFRDLVRIVASQSGGLVNYQDLATDSNLYYKKVKHFLSVLEETFLIKEVLPFHKNLTTELKKNPKIYFLDSGLRNLLVDNFSDLEFRSDKGRIAEGIVLSNLEYAFKAKGEVLFWRTTGGAELDFLLRRGAKLYPIEVKYRSMKKPKTTRALYSFVKTYNPEQVLVLTKDLWARKKIEGNDLIFAPACCF